MPRIRNTTPWSIGPAVCCQLIGKTTKKGLFFLHTKLTSVDTLHVALHILSFSPKLCIFSFVFAYFSLYPATKSSGLSSLPPPIFYPTPPPQPQPGDSDKSSTNAADRARIQVTILPGTFMGLSEFYCRDPRVVPRACLVSFYCSTVLLYNSLCILDSCVDGCIPFWKHLFFWNMVSYFDISNSITFFWSYIATGLRP